MEQRREELIQRLEELEAEIEEITAELAELETPEQRRSKFWLITGGGMAALVGAAMTLPKRLREAPEWGLAAAGGTVLAVGLLVGGSPAEIPEPQRPGPAVAVDPDPRFRAPDSEDLRLETPPHPSPAGDEAEAVLTPPEASPPPLDPGPPPGDLGPTPEPTVPATAAPAPSLPPEETDELLEICLEVRPRPVDGGRDGGALLDDCIRLLFGEREIASTAEPLVLAH